MTHHRFLRFAAVGVVAVGLNLILFALLVGRLGIDYLAATVVVFFLVNGYGFLANRRRRQLLPLCQQLLEAAPQQPSEMPRNSEAKPTPAWLCPCCGGPMVVIEKLTAQQIRRRSVDRKPLVDSS